MSFQPQEEQAENEITSDLIELDITEFIQYNHFDTYENLNFSSIIDIDENSTSSIGKSDIFDDFNEFDLDKNPLFKSNDNLEEQSFEDYLDNWMEQIDMLEINILNKSIEERSMIVDVQPPTDTRRRYESDGKRQIEKSRSKPMSIKLPNLKKCKLNSDLSFWLQLFLITTDQNPENIFYIHPDQLEYHSDDIQLSDDGFVRIPLTSDDIENQMKQLARISIIKKKLDTYTFKLVPFNPSLTEISIRTYENPTCKTAVAKAKCFRDLYNLTSSCIACQLVIKQNETWHITDIGCKTNIMEEKKQNEEMKCKKRKTSFDMENNSKESTKKKIKSISSSRKVLSK